MRVLSVDFDYFQKVSEKQLAFYPDGIDRDTELSEIVWGARYAVHGSAIREVGIMEDELDRLERILLNMGRDSPMMIANSHVHIYDFLHEYLKGGERLQLVNVDMHHDFMNDNPKMDCGNWIMHLAKEQKEAGERMEFNWIANPVSLDMYGFETDNILGRLVLPSLESIEDKSFDLAFLCRSDTWTPPHLDRYFTELCDLAKGHFNEITIEKGIDKPRTKYLEIAKETSRLVHKGRHGLRDREDNRQEHDVTAVVSKARQGRCSSKDNRGY